MCESPTAAEDFASALYTACINDNIEAVRSILSIDKKLAAMARNNHTGESVLMVVVERGFTDVTRELLQTGLIDVNQEDYHGMTALHTAAECGHPEICEILIQHGIDIDEIDRQSEDGQTALFRAVVKGQLEVVRVLLKHNADVNKC